jgi:hypothetical protein
MRLSIDANKRALLKTKVKGTVMGESMERVAQYGTEDTVDVRRTDALY